ncbi:MAG: hypothetical protein AAF636_07420 [Pseudomonadota bacterium]
MSDIQMDLTERLRARLEALQVESDYGSRGRKLFPADNINAFEALLQEIEETILRRAITFDTGERVIVFEVAERRCLKLLDMDSPSSASPSLLPSPEWSKGLTPDDASALSDWLVALCAGADGLWVRVDLCETSQGGVAVGITASQLSMAVSGLAPPSTYIHARQQSIPHCLGAAGTDGVIQPAADAALQSVLETRCEADAPAAGGCAVFNAWQSPDNRAIWLGRASGNGLVTWMAFEAEALPKLCAIWVQETDQI